MAQEDHRDSHPHLNQSQAGDLLAGWGGGLPQTSQHGQRNPSLQGRASCVYRPLLPPGSGSSPHLLPRNWTEGFLGGPEAPWSLLTWEFRWPGGKKPKGQDYLVPGPTWTYRADPAGICFLRPG